MNRLGTALAVMALTSASACGGQDAFTAKGYLAIVAANSTSADCSSGTGGYDDIQEGASVVVYDASGKKLAIGSLKAGRKYKKSSELCLFDFAVPDVPKGKGPYGVEVGSRGQISFTEKQSGKISISLG